MGHTRKQTAMVRAVPMRTIENVCSILVVSMKLLFVEVSRTRTEKRIMKAREDASRNE